MAGFAVIQNLGTDLAIWTPAGLQAKPRFSWVYTDADAQQSQSYRVRIYKASAGGASVYDSGVVSSVVASGSTMTHDSTYGMPNSGPAAFTNIAAGTSSSSTDANNYVTGTVTLKAGRLYLMAVENSKGSATADVVSSITGGPTFTSRSSVAYNTNLNRVSIWSAVPTADYTGTLTINFGGVTQTGAVWALTEVSGVDMSTTDGIVQQATGTGNSGTALATLAAFASTANFTFGAMAHAAATATTFGSGFTESSDQTTATPAQALETEHLLGNDTTVDATFTSAQWGACAIELASCERWWTVEVVDSSGESSGESSRSAFKVRWGQGLYEQDTLSAASSAWAFSPSAVPAGTAQAALFRSATGAGGAGANAWKASLGQVTIQRWANILIRLSTYTVGTLPALPDMTFSYFSSATAPDNWVTNQPSEWLLDEDLRRFTIKSFRETIASGTTGDRYLYPYRKVVGDDIPVVQNTIYTYSAYIKTDVPLTGGSLKLQIARAGSLVDILAQSTTGITDTSASPEGWQRIAVTFTTESAMTLIRPMVTYVRTTGVSTDKFWVDATQLEPGGVATPYHPSLAGRGVRLDVGGVMIDALYGGTLRVRGLLGGVTDVWEVGQRGILFGAGAEIFAKPPLTGAPQVATGVHIPSAGERSTLIRTWR